MCYGSGCIYENSNGECSLHGRMIPSDAACQEEDAEGYEDLYEEYGSDDEENQES